MKLRNFLYINTTIVEEYIEAIEGYSYDEESQSLLKNNENEIGGKVGIPLVKGEGLHTNSNGEEIKRSVRIGSPAKFDKIYKYLKEDEGLDYYESIDEDLFNKLKRDDFIEVLVTARFSKMRDLTDSIKTITELAFAVEDVIDTKLLDPEANATIKGITALGKLNEGKELSCVFEFDNKKYPLVAYLDESYLKCGRDRFVGQASMLCKVIRKIPKGSSIKLDEIFDAVKQLPLNREQKRKLSQNMDNPAELQDIIKGPAFVVLPIAVYQ